jgi:hypothetical protein
MELYRSLRRGQNREKGNGNTLRRVESTVPGGGFGIQHNYQRNPRMRFQLCSQACLMQQTIECAFYVIEASMCATPTTAPRSNAGDITPMRPHLAHLNKNEGVEHELLR